MLNQNVEPELYLKLSTSLAENQKTTNVLLIQNYQWQQGHGVILQAFSSDLDVGTFSKV